MAIVAPSMAFEEQEAFVVVVLDDHQHVMVVKLVALGSVSMVHVHPREVFREPIRLSASAVILVHNHPSGNPSPSEADESLTERLCKAGELVGVQVLDHVIIAQGGDWWSLSEHGQIPSGWGMAH